MIMNVINQSNQDVIRQLGGPQFKSKGRKYRMNKYCIEQPIEEGTLIHNFFTGATVMIRPFEYTNIYTDDPCDYAEFLVNNYFIVPEDFNEKELVDLIRSRQQVPFKSGYLDHPRNFTILSTTKCNARCFYCYEMQSKGKTHMTHETAEKVAKYIMEVAPKDQELEIGWFGGEPLYNTDVIEIITSRLNSAGIKFRGNMITNGYLIDGNMIPKIKHDWHITNMQITFDGTEEVYNKVKNYIYKDDVSPYKKVLDNVRLLLNHDITVSVRMNCDSHNFENLKVLVNELHEEFKEYGNFSMYVWPIFEEGFVRTEEQKKALYDNIIELDKLILSLGYPLSHGLYNGIKGTHCMVDSGDAITINPRGDIGICEHYIDKNFIGHIDTPYEKDMEVLKAWRDYSAYTEICDDCQAYPQCLRVKQCPDEVPCEKHQKNYWLEHYKSVLIGVWKMHLSQLERQNQQNQQNNQCCRQDSQCCRQNNQNNRN